MIVQVAQFSTIALVFFIFLVVLEQLLRRRSELVLQVQSKRHQKEKGFKGLWQSFLRIWKKSDRVPAHISPFAFRFFPYLYLMLIVVMALNFGRNDQGILLGEYLVFVVIFLALSIISFFHTWILGKKTTILAFFEQLESQLLIDFGLLAISGIMIFLYDGSSLSAIENKQQLWWKLGVIQAPIGAFLAFFLIPAKFGQHPYSAILNSENTAGEYSGLSRSIMQKVPAMNFCIALMLYIFLFLGGGNDYGILEISWLNAVSFIKPYISFVAKFTLLVILLHTVFLSFPRLTGKRIKLELKRWLFPLTIGQIVMTIVIWMRQ